VHHHAYKVNYKSVQFIKPGLRVKLACLILHADGNRRAAVKYIATYAIVLLDHINDHYLVGHKEPYRLVLTRWCILALR
jgi:hypothetical protein